MPILKKSGREIQIPFNPQAIAQLLYEGHEVFPDPDTPPERVMAESEMIKGELRGLWGDQKLRTVPGRREEAGGSSFGWEQDFRWKDTLPTPKSTNFMQVLPNPGVLYRMPMLQNNPNPSGILEARSKDDRDPLADLDSWLKKMDKEPLSKV